MKKHTYSGLVILAIALIAGNCKQVYEPPAIKGSNNYLVVDGLLNAGPDSTIVRLSRSWNLGDSITGLPELNATVAVVAENAGSIPLQELGNGLYAAANLNLDVNQQYALSITTANGSQYLSDYVPVKMSPAIDSVSWDKTDKGVQIYANTHDPQNNTHYYRWEYEETWEYRSAYDSQLKYVDSTVSFIPRPLNQHVFTCWHMQRSTDILIGSSTKFSADVIYRQPIILIPDASEQINIRYSILLKQFALTQEAYEYWQKLKKNTEELGGVFDAQPSQLTGNIHCVSNPGEPVLGYVSAGTMTQKRIFITKDQVLPWLFFVHPECFEYNVPNIRDSLIYYFGVDHLNYEPLFFDFTTMTYLGAPELCVDCTLWGGTTVKPSYWP